MQNVRLNAAVAIAAALSISACASVPAATEIASATSTANGQKKICKRMPVMGSNFPKTVCSTAEEWVAFDEANRSSVDSFDKDRRAGNTQGDFEN